MKTLPMILSLVFLLFLNVSLLGQEVPLKSPPEVPFKSPYESGVLTLGIEYIDDLLFLDKVPSMRILEITFGSYKVVSSAHLALLLRWVNSGGIIWIHQDGFNSTLFKKVNPGIFFKEVIVKKESGATFSPDAGELFVKGLLPQISIANHSITEGVNMLYISPYSKEFVATIVTVPKIKIVPIINFKSSEEGLLINSSGKEEKEVKKVEEVKKVGEVKEVKKDRKDKKEEVVKEDEVVKVDVEDVEDEIFILLGLIEKENGLLIIDTTRLGSNNRVEPAGNEYDWLQFYNNIKSYSHRKAPLEDVKILDIK